MLATNREPEKKSGRKKNMCMKRDKTSSCQVVFMPFMYATPMQ
jgi:hypothetical protein